MFNTYVTVPEMLTLIGPASSHLTEPRTKKVTTGYCSVTHTLYNRRVLPAQKT
jgi:hypothetical protein